MNSTVSKSSSIRPVPKRKITALDSLQAETFHSSLSCVNSSNNISPTIWSEESYLETISSTSDNYSEQTSKNIKSTINYEEQNKSKRTKIIIIIIIILLILVVIAMIVTWIILLKSQDTTNKTKTSITIGNTNSYSGTTSTIRTPIIYDVGNGGASGGPPCSSYTVVNDPLRNVATSGMGGTCDNGPLFNTSIGGRWIRFVGIGGTTIPLTSPGRSHCGAFLSGWFNGTLPSTIGTIVSADNVTDYNSHDSFDIIVPNYHSNNIGAFLNNGHGTFSTSTSYLTYPMPRTVAIADLNDDNKNDIIVDNGTYIPVILTRSY